MECKNCGCDDVICSSCKSSSGLQGWIQFNIDELNDLVMNLKQCISEGYIQPEDHSYECMWRIILEIGRIEND